MLPDTEIRLQYNHDTGAIDWQSARGQAQEGSWSTHLLVRSDGQSVSVSGNPSRWGRLDNVFGLTTLRDCIAVYNRVLLDLGLPEFELLQRAKITHGTAAGAWAAAAEATKKLEAGQSAGAARLAAFLAYAEAAFDDSDVDGLRVGPVITRVDLTQNLLFGRGGEGPAIDWFLAQRFGRLPFKPKGDLSISAGSMARQLLKLYGKADEVAAHALEWRRARSQDKRMVRDEAIEYLENLRDWLKENGVVRRELTLGRKLLPELDLRFPENWRDDTAAKVYRERTAMKSLEAGALSDYSGDVRARLEANGFGPRRAAAMANAVAAWIGGGEWDSGLSRSTRYEYIAALRNHCGLDLRNRCNVRSMAHSVKPRVLEGRPMTSADLPDWYRSAA
jgi:hypothetical protein